MFSVSSTVNFRNFGYIPRHSFKENLTRWLFGEANLFKRLQAKDIMASLALKPDEVALDLGCANGYLSIEMAKQAKHVTAIDINPYVKKIRIPDSLQNKLTFIHGSGDKIQAEDSTFDVILASEVLTMIEEPDNFLQEIKRLLKPGGRVVFVNGVGRPNIEEMYANDPLKLEKYKKQYGDGVPATYEDYVQKLTKSFGTSIHSFLSESEYKTLIAKNGLTIVQSTNSPKRVAADKIFLKQFELFVKTGSGLSHDNFVLQFYYLSFLSLFDSKGSKAGSIIVATYNP